MIKELVDLLSVFIHLFIILILIAGGFLGYYAIPMEWPYFDEFNNLEFFELEGVWRAIIGVVTALILQVIFLSPALILIDTRNAIRSMERKIGKLNENSKS